MYLKCPRRRNDGKEHRYWSIVESRRTARGVAQRQVLHLGEANDSQREVWRKAVLVFDEDTQSEWELAVYPADRPLPEHAADLGVRVRLDSLRVFRPRSWGACWLALALWRLLQLDRFW